MKRSFTQTGAALLTLTALTTACDKERTETLAEQRSGSPITFSPVVGRQTAGTRAKEFGYWQPGETLDVTSFITGDTTASPTTFHLIYEGPNTTSWTYSPLKEMGETPVSYTYYAYYPTGANVSNLHLDGLNGNFSYTVRPSASQEDLITAKTTTAYSRVPLLFRHALSEINFAVQAKQDIHIDIQNIKLNAIADAADFTFSPSGGSWTTPTGSATYPYTPTDGVTFPTDGSNNDLIYLGNLGEAGNDIQNSHTNALMLMPQKFPHAAGGYISFDYALIDSLDQPMKSGNAKVYLGDFTTNEWKMGKRYLYLLDLAGLVEEGPITFEVIMFGWSDDMSKVAQPVLVSDGTQVLIEKGITFQNTEKAAVPSLTVFPVSLPNAPMVGGPNDKIVLSNFSWDNFATGDQVRILCFSYSDALRIGLDQTKSDLVNAWTVVYPEDPGVNPDTSKGIEVVLIRQ